MSSTWKAVRLLSLFCKHEGGMHHAPWNSLLSWDGVFGGFGTLLHPILQASPVNDKVPKRGGDPRHLHKHEIPSVGERRSTRTNLGRIFAIPSLEIYREWNYQSLINSSSRLPSTSTSSTITISVWKWNSFLRRNSDMLDMNSWKCFPMGKWSLLVYGIWLELKCWCNK